MESKLRSNDSDNTKLMEKAQKLTNTLAVDTLRQNTTKPNYLIATASLTLVVAMATVVARDVTHDVTNNANDDVTNDVTNGITDSVNHDVISDAKKHDVTSDVKHDVIGDVKHDVIDDVKHDVTHDEEESDVHKPMKWLLQILRGKCDLTGNEVTLLNNVWLGKQTNLSKNGKALLSTYYNCETQQLPVGKDGINERKLKGKLHKLDMSKTFRLHINDATFKLPHTSLNDEGVLLTTATHLTTLWREPFAIHLTRHSEFFVNENQSVQAEMMSQRVGLVCVAYDKLRVRVLEVPLTARKMSVLFYLPDKINALSFLEKHLTAEIFDEILTNIGTTRAKPVDFSMPKFSLFTNEINEHNNQVSFSSQKFENFWNFSTIHHAVGLSVNEQGLNVPMHSGVGMMSLIGPAVHGGLRWTTFKMDHPFLFMVVDVSSRVIFLAGKVCNPTQLQDFSFPSSDKQTSCCCI